MCTAVSCRFENHYFGRNLDVEGPYGETVAITPRNYPFNFKESETIKNHYAFIGVAKIANGYPLYFDATNEKGLSMAALNFPGNAHYSPPVKGRDNITPYELFPWILGQCKDVDEAKKLLENINISDISFSETLPLTPLHWIISDRNESVAVEPTKDGLKMYDNPVGVLTNNPSFDIQLFNLNNYIGLSASPPENTFAHNILLKQYSRGMGALGLPGDLSSMSRFVRATFTKCNILPGKTEEECVSQFFHILDSVCQQKGCVYTEKNELEYTSYSSCCNTDNGLFYYKTYENSTVNCISLFGENLDGNKVISYPILREAMFHIQNGER